MKTNNQEIRDDENAINTNHRPTIAIEAKTIKRSHSDAALIGSGEGVGH